MADRRPRAPRKKPLRITTRDVQIFEDLLQRRADSLGALHERHWPDASKETARNRLGALVAWGYLERHGLDHTHPSLKHPGDNDRTVLGVYTPTAKAISALRRRSLAGSLLRGRSFKTEIAEPSIPHQLAVNRIGDLLGARLVADHLLDITGDRRHRPDATYRALPDETGRTAVMLEVDLGHYSRQRILGKARTFLADPDAKGVLFACPTDTRADWVADTLRAAHGDRIMDRVQVLTFKQIQDGRLLLDTLRPQDGGDEIDDAYAHLPRAA